jgi:hypothetical protein
MFTGLVEQVVQVPRAQLSPSLPLTVSVPLPIHWPDSLMIV